MAEDMNETTAGDATTLEQTAHISITELTPLIVSPSTRALRAIITLTHPYSSATGSVAYKLSEPDFRLRLKRGEVRVHFSGSSAKTVTKSGIAIGDEIVLSLDGAEFVPLREEGTVSTPNRGLDFELRFTERLLLQFRQTGSQNAYTIDIDHPEPEPQPELPAQILIPEPEESPAVPITNLSDHPEIEMAPDEFSSPAFKRRLETSYGSLFEAALEDQDGSVKGKGRKRTRLTSMWRYTSRSPTPETEESEGKTRNDTSLKAVMRPVMMDEGVQTMDSEDDTAETLANFARQSTNIGRISYDRFNGNMSSSFSSLNRSIDAPGHENPTLPPALRTEFHASEDMPESGIGLKLPSSPRLQPLSSEKLPLVSPLIQRSYVSFTDGTSLSACTPQTPSFNQSPSKHNNHNLQEEGDEDLYSASPAGHRGKQSVEVFHGFQGPANGLGGMEMSNIEVQYTPEDQYGHWQTNNAQLSHSASPHKVVDGFGNDAQPDQFQVENHEEDYYFNSGLPISHMGVEEHVHQYPDPDIATPGLSAWRREPKAVAYPGISDPEDKQMPIPATSPQARYVAMSRSQSAQSQVVDLSERSDDENANETEDEEDYLEESRLGHPIGQDYEGSTENYEEYNKDEQPADVVRNRHFTREFTHVDGGSTGSQAEEQLEQEEKDEQGNPYPLGFYPSPGQTKDVYDSEDDQGSYDEESMGDEESQSSSTQREPEVIDLLSSDDEEEDIPVKTTKLPPPYYVRASQASMTPDEDEGDGDSDEDINEGNRVRYTERHELQISTLPGTERELESEDKDDNSVALANHESDEESIKPSRNIEIIQHSETANVNEIEDELEDKLREIREASEDLEDNAAEASNTALDSETNLRDGKDPSGITDEHVNDFLDQVEEIQATKSDQDLNGLEDDEDNGRVDNDQENEDPEPSKIEVDYFIKPPLHQAEQHLTRKSQDRPSLFARIFNLDGANDDPEIDVFYPTLPNHEPLHPADTLEQDDDPKRSDGNAQEQKYAQLPTRDVTQPSQKTTSLEVSFTSVSNVLTTESQKDSYKKPFEIIDELPGAPATDDVEIKKQVVDKAETAETINNSEPFSITDETTKITIKEELVATSQGEEVEIVAEERSTDRKVEKEIEEVVQHKPDITAEDVRSVTPLEYTTKTINTKENDRPVTPLGYTTKVIKTREIHRPVTPVKFSNTVTPSSSRTNPALPMVMIDDRSTPTGHDASVERAQYYDLRSPPVPDLRLRLSRILRTDLQDFTALKVLRYHLNQKLNVLAIATTTPPEPQRAKSGPRHHLITFNVTDPSVTPSRITEIQVFRPYKEALPVVKAGDGVLLRNFVVISVKRGFALRSEEASSWVVFKEDDEEEVRGPPVEYGDKEKHQIAQMKVWYGGLDGTAMAKLNRTG